MIMFCNDFNNHVRKNTTLLKYFWLKYLKTLYKYLNRYTFFGDFSVQFKWIYMLSDPYA